MTEGKLHWSQKPVNFEGIEMTAILTNLLLTTIFVLLKVMGLIEWSWLWVMGPLYFTAILIFYIVFIIALHGTIKGLCND